MASQRETEDRTGEYGGDDGALENERVEIAPREDPGAVDLADGAPRVGKNQAERTQDKDLETGEENPA